ncbi:MAG: carboxypeptidase regulatory-like domain-containing protein [Polyangiaceae bacterium]|nr:carboxypeptidase regulatory-like domain-containing protein [Polyangiaceae bacterium]
MTGLAPPTAQTHFRSLRLHLVVALLLVGTLVVVLRFWLDGMPLQNTTRLGLDDTVQQLNMDRYRSAPAASGASCHVSGIVLEAAGQEPISGAVVALTAVAARPEGSGTEADQPWIATSDLEGRWSATIPDAGEYAVAVTAPRFKPEARSLPLPCRLPDAPMQVTLRRGGATVGGDVWGVQGEPMADAMVTVQPLTPDSSRPSTPARWVTFTNDFGNFWLSLVPGDYLFEVSVPFAAVRNRLSGPVRRRGPAAGSPESVFPSTTETQTGPEPPGHIRLCTRTGIGPRRNIVVLRLPPTGSIHGRVLNQTDGAPVPNAVVSALTNGAGRSESRQTPTVMADATGEYVLEDVPAGTVLLTAVAGELTTREPTPVGISVARWASGIDVWVERGRTLSGRIVRRSHPKQGLGGQWVTATDLEFGRVIAALRPTDGDGTFKIAGLARGSYTLQAGPRTNPRTTDVSITVSDTDVVDLVVEVDPDGRDGSAMVRVRDEDQTDRVVHLEPRASVVGRLMNKPDGAVSLLVGSLGVSSHDGMSFFGDAPVRADGTFSLQGLDLGRYWFAAYRNGERIALDLSEEDRGFVLDVRRPGLQPEVTLGARRCKGIIMGGVVGPDEAFVPEALVEARFFGDEPPDALVPQAGPQTLARLRRDAPNQTVVTNAFGTFVFHCLCSGLYELTASARFGQWRARATAVSVNTGTVLQLLPTATMETTVTYRGAPVVGYVLNVLAPVELTRPVHSSDGRAVLSHLDAGKLEAVVEAASGYAVASADLLPERRARLALDLVPWRSIVGRLVDARGQPQPGVLVDVSFARSTPEEAAEASFFRINEHQTTTDADGRFELEHALARRGRISFVDSSGNVLVTKHPVPTTMGAVEGLNPWVFVDLRTHARLALGTLEVQQAQ